MSLGLIPYFSLFTAFIFSADCFIIVTARILALILSNMPFTFHVLLIFYSTTNDFPPLRLVVNIVTL